jgi:isoleucyl-tRNA synthetase
MGHVQDMEGRKMSKHLGNVVDPWTVLDAQGADAVRWYFYIGSMPWLPSRFSAEAVSEAQRKFIGTFWNTYAFYILYAEIDKFDPTQYKLEDCQLSEMDRWVLSRLNTLIKTVDGNLDKLRITEGGRALQAFSDELSNWYVRRCRDRFWGSEMSEDKKAAYMTLYTALHTLNLLTAPFLPFMTEGIYQNIVRSVDSAALESVHFCDYPTADENRIDAELEANMARVLEIVTLGRAARNDGTVKTRQPLALMYIQGEPMNEHYVKIVTEELNVKKAEFVNDASGFLRYQVKPQLKTLGPRYGKILPKIGAHLSESGIGNLVVRAHAAGKNYEATIEEVFVVLGPEDVLVSTGKTDGFVAATDNETIVVLDTKLTPELIDEGFVRELISKVQTMRKEAGFEVSDHIALSYDGSAKIEEIFSRFGDEILSETLGETLSKGAVGYTKDWDVNKEAVTLGVEKK